jgi:hypothetical protein
MIDLSVDEVKLLDNHGWGYAILATPENVEQLKSLEERGYLQRPKDATLFTLTRMAQNVIS